MKRLLVNQKFWAVLGAGLLVAAVSGSAFARQMDNRNMPRLEARQDTGLTTSISPLPTPTVQPTPELENEMEFTGVVEALAADSWVIGGRTVLVTAATEIKPGLGIGMLAKVHVVRQADGSLLAREIEPTRLGSHDAGISNGNEDHGNINPKNNHDADDHSDNVNSNDTNGHEGHGGSVNSNKPNNHNDHGGDGNSNHHSSKDR